MPMKTIFDRKFVRNYARIIAWQNVWTNFSGSIWGLVWAASAVVFLVGLRFGLLIAPDGDGDFLSILSDVNSTLELAFGLSALELMKSLGFNNYLLFWLPVFVFVAILIGRRFGFWKIRAEAEHLIATGEIADNTSGNSFTEQTTGVGLFLHLLAWVPPVLVLTIWVVVFRAFFSEPGTLRLTLHPTDSPEVYILDLGQNIGKYQSIDARFDEEAARSAGTTDESFFYTSTPYSTVCQSRWVWVVLESIEEPDPETSESEQLHEDPNLYEVRFEEGSAEVRPGEEEKLLKILRRLDGDDELEIDLVGRSDTEGPRETGLLLAAQRLNAVIDWFKSRGVSGYQIDGRHIDEDLLTATYCIGGVCEYRNRVVEIRVENRFVVLEAPVIVESETPSFDIPDGDFAELRRSSNQKTIAINGPITHDGLRALLRQVSLSWRTVLGVRGTANMDVKFSADNLFVGKSFRGIATEKNPRVCMSLPIW